MTDPFDALQIAVFGLVFTLLGVCTDGGYALLAGAVGPRLRRSTRFLRGERYLLTNLGEAALALESRWFSTEGVLGVAVEQMRLEPQASTNVFVLRAATP